jgi:hypothetical protein
MIGVFCQESPIKRFGSISFIHSNITVIVVFLSVASFTHFLTPILFALLSESQPDPAGVNNNGVSSNRAHRSAGVSNRAHR